MVRSKTIKARLTYALILFIVALITLVSLAPIIHTLALSLSNQNYALAGQVYLLPKGFTMEAYKRILGDKAFFDALFISVKRVAAGGAINVVMVILMAFPLSRSKKAFRFRDAYMWFIIFVMLFSGGLIPWYMTISALGMGGNKIILVFKTHFDIGFTELVSDLVARWDSKMFPDLFRVCEETRALGAHRYVWTVPSWPLYRYLTEFASGEALREKAAGLVRGGQLAWHALPFTTYTEFCGLEEYIRGLLFARALGERFGRQAVSAKMTDVLGHTWILPSLLAGAGVKILHLGPNQALKLPEVPLLFFWEGPDGARVLTFYNRAGGYGSSLVPPEDWPFPVWLGLVQTNDNTGPQGPEDIGYLLEAVEEQAPGTTAVTGSLDDFYNALAAYDLSGLPVVRGDIADTWIHGIASMPREVAALRALRHALTETEKADSLRILQGGAFYTQAMALAYEKSLLFGEHTWGLNTFRSLYMKEERVYKKVDLWKNGDLAMFEASWDEQRQYCYDARRIVDEVRTQALSALAAGRLGGY